MDGRHKSVLASSFLIVLTGSFYLRPDILSGGAALVGMDYDQMHLWRIKFAREALFGPGHSLPAWYPFEVLGSPFAANLQSFPWIPTRLILLLLDPTVAYAAGIAIAAALSAIFTFLYCRRAGLSGTGAVAAGGTFACAGFFASRVMAGHLPLLEAYPALPLLLWLVDRSLDGNRANKRRFDLGVLAFACACVVSAGHPQIPAYAFGSAVVYAVWQERGAPAKLARVVSAMALGVGLAMAVWWPMLLLIGRSTRMLHLAAPANDIAMPYGRLLALLLPGHDGWPRPVALSDTNPFTEYPNAAYFWDTASYIGILPLMAVGWLSAARGSPNSRWRCLTCLGIGALFFSLPLGQALRELLPGTVFRSPARLLYISTFCASVALGVAADRLRRSRFSHGLIVVLLSAHFFDLWGFAHRFIELHPRMQQTPAIAEIPERELADGRVAVQSVSELRSASHRYEDVGGFDSIFLAPFSQALLALSDAPHDKNWQAIDASTLPLKALRATGVRFAITTDPRPDLQLIRSSEDIYLYRIPGAAPRAEVSGPNGRSLITYERPSSDEIILRTVTGAPGVAHVLEAYDTGWGATVDGSPAAVTAANGFSIGVHVPAGGHTVRLRYSTPGRGTGELISLVSLGLLAMLMVSSRVETQPAKDQSAEGRSARVCARRAGWIVAANQSHVRVPRGLCRAPDCADPAGPPDAPG